MFLLISCFGLTSSSSLFVSNWGIRPLVSSLHIVEPGAWSFPLLRPFYAKLTFIHCAIVRSCFCRTGWWFGTFFIFPYIGNNSTNLYTIFFRGVETTNQIMMYTVYRIPQMRDKVIDPVGMFDAIHPR